MTGEFSEHSVDAEDGQHEHSNGIFVVTTVFGNPVIGVATDYHGDVDEYPIMLAVAEDTKYDLLYWYDDLQDFEQVEAASGEVTFVLEDNGESDNFTSSFCVKTAI